MKQFRQSVLAAAFRGELTCRITTDVPAAELIKSSEIQSQKSDSLQRERRRTPIERDHKNRYGLPNGWEWVRFSDITSSQNGRSFPSRFYTDDGIRLLRPGNLNVNGKLVWTPKNTRYLPQEFADEYPNYLVKSGDIVMNLTAQSLKDDFLGRVCVADDSMCLLNQRQAKIVPASFVDSNYLFWILRSPIFRSFVRGLESGTLIQHIFTWQLDSFSLPLAPLKEQKLVVKRIEGLMSNAEQVEISTKNTYERVSSTERAILSKAFRGGLAA